MGKVKLTEEQSEVLEKMRNCHHLRNDKDALLVKHARGWSQSYVVLNEITMIEFAKLVLDDFAYEIEPEQPKFQVGDKVITTTGEEVPRILTLIDRKEITGREIDKYGAGWKFGESNFAWLGEKQFRHATPEEIFWLEALGREKVGGFREGDVIFTIYDSLFKVVNSEFGSDDFVSVTNAKALKPLGIYPAESFKPFPKEPE